MKDPAAGSGIFVPISTAQRFDLTDAVTGQGTMTNSVHLPFVFALQFGGTFVMKGVRLRLASCRVHTGFRD